METPRKDSSTSIYMLCRALTWNETRDIQLSTYFSLRLKKQLEDFDEILEAFSFFPSGHVMRSAAQLDLVNSLPKN